MKLRPSRPRLRRRHVLACLTLPIVVGLAAEPAQAGGFVFSGDTNGLNVVTHPSHYDGTGGHLTVEVCIDPAAVNADAMVIPVQNIVRVINALEEKSPNLFFGANNDIPSGSIDFESLTLHEFGHCIGLAHPNLGVVTGVSGANTDYTRSTRGGNSQYDFGTGADGVIGSSDDVRGDDVNLTWFPTATNNPFLTPATVDSATYSRDPADLPAGDTFAANASRAVGAALGYASTEAVMQQGQGSDEDQRALAADDVATLRYAMTGLDEIAGTADDYTFSLAYAGKTTDCDIVVRSADTGFGSCSFGGTFPDHVNYPNHISITTGTFTYNSADFNWYFNQVPNNLATAVVRKETIPAGATETFTFTGDIAGSVQDGEEITQELTDGSWTSTETVPAGWELESVTCDDADSTGDVGTGTATFNLDAGETVTCVFRNRKTTGTMIVEKQTDPDGASQSFAFTGDAAGSIQDNGQITVNDLAPGTYTATETATAGWSLAGISCNDANSTGDTATRTATFNLEAGETVTCTFDNTQLGTIVVEKQTDPDGATQSFTFTGDAAGSIQDNGQITVNNLAPGTYTTTEAVTAGWSLTGITCDDANSTGDTASRTATFNLEAGETVTCTFNNTQLGAIIVEKQTDPDGSAQSFTFTGDAAGAIQDNGQITVNNLAPGTYTATEAATAGWSLAGITCNDANSTGDSASRTATFNLEAGETVTCTFNNTQLGTIIVEKQTDPDGATQSFTFTGDAAGSIQDNGQITVNNLAPGTYTATEAATAGWSLAGITCDDANSTGDTASRTATFNLEAGETVTCTFNNTQVASCPIGVDHLTLTSPPPITGTQTVEACRTITVGPPFTVKSNGVLTLQAGEAVIFANDTEIANGAAVTVLLSGP